jgi:hypothetical protein
MSESMIWIIIIASLVIAAYFAFLDWITRDGRYAFVNYRLGQRVEAGVFCDAHAKDLEAPANCTVVKVRRVRARCEMCSRRMCDVL